jgi:hypothetical protein
MLSRYNSIRIDRVPLLTSVTISRFNLAHTTDRSENEFLIKTICTQSIFENVLRTAFRT